MPRMQLYLPEDLYKQVKELRLPASELLQRAVRDEIRRRKLDDEADRYFAELEAELGPPTPEEDARAEAWVQSIVDELKQRGR